MLCNTCRHGHIISGEDEEGNENQYVHCNYSDIQIVGDFTGCSRYQFENKMFGGLEKCFR